MIPSCPFPLIGTKNRYRILTPIVSQIDKIQVYLSGLKITSISIHGFLHVISLVQSPSL